MKGPVVVAAFAAAVAALGVPTAEAQLQPQGALDAQALVASDAWGGALTVDLWGRVAGPLRVGGVLGVGAVTSEDDARSRVLMPFGASASLLFGESREPFVELRVRAGGWGGATNQGFAVGGWLAGGGYVGYALGPNVAVGGGISAWLLLGHGHLLAVAPGLTLSWLPFEG